MDFRLRLAFLLLHARAVPPNVNQTRIMEMAEYLQNHYHAHTLSIAEISRQAGYSPNYVQQLFRKELGMPPAAYLRKLRMEAAGRFLRENRYLIKEIAQLCGFADPHFFTAAFRKYYRCAPSEFTRQERDVTPDTF